MKKSFILLIASLIALSCEDNRLTDVDAALEEAPVYNAALQDSLQTMKARLLSTTDEAARWNEALSIYEVYSHYQLDSCLVYANMLVSLAGNEPTRKVISAASLSKATFRLDRFVDALHIFESIDTSGILLTGSVAEAYFTAGEWVYKGMSRISPLDEYYPRKLSIIESAILSWGDKNIETINLKYSRLCNAGQFEEALSLVRKYMNGMNLTSGQYARTHYYLSRIYHLQGEQELEEEHLALSASADLKAANKNYNSLYSLALILYSRGDLQRASLYIRKNLDDAIFSHSSHRMLRSAKSEIMLSDALQESERSKTQIRVLVLVLLGAVAAALLIMKFRDKRYMKKLSEANQRIHDLSRIKETFLAKYMEMSALYIGKVDENRSHLRKTLKTNGVEALKALLREPSFADSEMESFYRNFDTAFLGIYPDFIRKVNTLLRKEYAFPENSSTLSTQLRILALIRLGITERARITKILHISAATVYTWHSRTLRAALPSDTPFDELIKKL